MSFNVNQCDKFCTSCIKGYGKKHRIGIGEDNPFKIVCSGIPKDYIGEDMREVLQEEESKAAVTMLDSVAWAGEILDWHCLDPDGEIWKRKNPEEYHKWLRSHPDEDILGHSRYHRPYQATILRCSSQYKAFRLGRRLGKTEAIVIVTLFNAFVKPGLPEDEGCKIIVIAPYQTQVDLVFKRIEELLKSNPSASNAVKSKVKSPIYKIEFYNGSVIKGFTAGVKSGGNSDSIRGSDAHILIFDEADYLSEADIDSALSVTIDHPDALVWMSSTPKGTRGKFFQNCNSRLYKEFYYPSYINPMWTEKTDLFFKENLTESGYKHEILAEWGEEEEGVFQATYIEAALADFEYGQLSRDRNWFFFMGVDWNDVKIGTTIAVVGLDTFTGKTYLMDKHVVSREGWTQLSACQKIADLNRFWGCSFIYVDEGYGSTQIEILRKYGYDAVRDPMKGPLHPDAKLKDIIKSYNFSSKIMIHDLITGEEIPKPAKPFLVENTVRRFETNTFYFPRTDTILIRQLKNYVVDHVTNTGVPVYRADEESIGDHLLDAVMLALVGITLEKTSFGRPLARADFTFAGKFGEKIEELKEQSGGILIQNTRKEDSRRHNRPDMERTSLFAGDAPLFVKSRVPGNHLNRDLGGVQLWSWPGFERDEPKPSLNSKIRKEGPNATIRTEKPKRKNI